MTGMAENRAGSRTNPELARVLELVGRRWTLRILWELRGRTLPFNDVRRAVGGMSQSVLVTRLTELFGAGLIADVPGGYQLTADGAALVDQLSGLETWAARWGAALADPD
jgi:DNA-binding HxlR family transcriptional regulator